MSSRSLELEHPKSRTRKSDGVTLLEHKESLLARLAQLVIITIIAATTRIIVFFTLKI